MTEDTTPDPIRRLANRQADQVQRLVLALLVESVDQVRAKPNTWQHEEVSLSSRDLAEEALAVDGVAPQDVVFATARSSSALIVSLCDRIGADPLKLVKGFEENYFRMSP